MSRLRIPPLLVFAGIFLLLLALYWPARDAGWVSDTLGWLDAVRTQSFDEFVNRSGFSVRSFYQTTQTVTWLLHRLFGADRLAWHLVHLALQAANATLLFMFFMRLLEDSRLPGAGGHALLAVLLFSLSPSLSEVIVWEAAFHYLQGLAFIAIQLLLLQAGLRRSGASLPVVAALLFALASFSLELFYLTPAFSFLLLLYYRFGAPAAAAGTVRRVSRNFLLPQLAILALHLLLVRLSYGVSTGRLGDGLWEHPLSYFAIKPPDYILHLAGGRFLPQSFRSAWHRFFCTWAGAGLFYAALSGSLSYILFRFRKMSASGQIISWAWCATLAAMALVTPMWFPERLLVMGDRYLYLMLPFVMLIVSLVTGHVRRRSFRLLLPALLLVASGLGVWRMAALWGASERLTQTMQQRFPRLPAGTRVLLLNNPANYNGVPMSGAGPDGEFGLLRRLCYRADSGVEIIDGFAAEYTGPAQVPRVSWVDSHTLRVTLGDSSRRWWFGPDYATSFGDSNYVMRVTGPARYTVGMNAGALPLIVVWDGLRFIFLKENRISENY